jgi:transcription termination factor Rho
MTRTRTRTRSPRTPTRTRKTSPSRPAPRAAAVAAGVSAPATASAGAATVSAAAATARSAGAATARSAGAATARSARTRSSRAPSTCSGFVRLVDGETSDEDVYISAAQVKRCELVSGDRVSGPVRPPRRSERFASLIRIDTINDKPADEVAEGTRFDDLPVTFPNERLALGSEDPTLKAIEWLTPFGKGSRVVVAGPARAGKTEALRRLAGTLAGLEGLEVSVVLAGVRPEEISEWQSGEVAVSGAQSFAASAESQAGVVEQAIEQGRRVAARGGDAVVLIDSLEHVTPGAARRALASARNIVDGGSLTVIAAAPSPLGGETTVITLDPSLTSLGRFPALALGQSGTMRADLLVGDAGAEAIAKARAEALG